MSTPVDGSQNRPFRWLGPPAPSKLASARSPWPLAIGGLCHCSVVHRQGLPNDVTSCQKSIIRRHVWGVASELVLEAAAGPYQSPSFARFKLKHSFDPPAPHRPRQRMHARIQRSSSTCNHLAACPVSRPDLLIKSGTKRPSD